VRYDLRLPRVALAAALTLSACGEHENLSRDIEKLRDHVAALERSVDEHAIAIASVSSVSGVQMEEEMHEAAIQPHMDGMHHELGDMESCKGDDGAGPPIGRLGDMLGNIQHECDTHRDTMRDAANLDAAHAEEARHETAMDEMTSSMREEMDRMMRDEDMMSRHECPDDMHGM
jgi:cell division septum initiation protein DivIVA